MTTGPSTHIATPAAHRFFAPFGHAPRGDDASGLFGELEGCLEVVGFAEGVEFAVAVAVVVVAVGDDVSVVGVVDAAVAGS